MNNSVREEKGIITPEVLSEADGFTNVDFEAFIRRYEPEFAEWFTRLLEDTVNNQYKKIVNARNASAQQEYIADAIRDVVTKTFMASVVAQDQYDDTRDNRLVELLDKPYQNDTDALIELSNIAPDEEDADKGLDEIVDPIADDEFGQL